MIPLYRILYVDDDPHLLEIARFFLEDSGDFSVTASTSAMEALKLPGIASFDAIVADYQMPRMDGIAFLKKVREAHGSIPFILFTGKGQEEVVIEAINEGADFYLQKGGDPNAEFAELIRKIRLAVGRQRADKTLLHFNSLYAVLSGVNTTIVRAKSRQELFAEICRIAVEKGGFAMAWIGLVDTARTILTPVAGSGREDGHYGTLDISPGENSPGPEGLAVRAVQEGTHVICNDILRDPRMEPRYPAIGKQGYHATAAFPFFIRNTIAGVLQLYAGEENFFSEGEVCLLDEVASDISFALERLEAEEMRARTQRELKESEEKLAAVVAGSPVPQFVIGRDHRVIYWNRALEVLTGISAGELVGTCNQWRAFYPQERPTMADLILDGESGRICELYAGKIVDSPVIAGAFDVTDFFPHLGDKGRWLRFMAAPILNDSGITLGAIETLVDITATRQAEEELRQSYETIAAAEEELRGQLDKIVLSEEQLRASEERYRRFIETSSEGVWSMDRDFIVTLVNQRLAEMLGYPMDEMIGRPVSSFMHPEDLADNTRQIADRQKGRSGRYERRFVHRDGTTIHTLVSATPLLEGGEFAGSFAMITDISDRIAAEDALKQVNRKLNLLSSITRHDILDNISVCRGYLTIAKRKFPDPGVQEQLDLLESIIGTIHAQISFTKSYQDLGVVAPTWQNINNVLPIRAVFHNIPVIAELSDLEVFSDPLIGKVFINLHTNTVQHGQHATEIHVRAEKRDNDLVIIWEDNGIGIPPGEKEMIFERGIGRYTGLGLFFVREILGITGISIKETGKRGKGARFEITVPQGMWRITGRSD